ncbi:site-specific integrase [Terrihabitans rhizophilus]|uniref:site-specific integrase n=1 Tax=Terrihabitans rhizophilus TaxID=3092662 RepID=UPI003CC50FD3
MSEWGVSLNANPLSSVRNPRADPSRTRRLESGEWHRLERALASCRNPLVPLVARFALATGMRRGEILSLRWFDVDRSKHLAHLRMTKNGQPRTVPLSLEAMQVLEEARLRTDPLDDRVFSTSAEAVKLSWKRAVKRGDLDDLRFHDLRHEAISRFFEKGLSLPEVALISGHKDPRMLFRYTHLKAELIVSKLN